MARPAAPRSPHRTALTLALALALAGAACGGKSTPGPLGTGGGAETPLKPATPTLEELVGKRIARVDVAGVSELRRDEVRGALYTRVGDPVDLDVVSKDVRTIWSLGGIKDVRAEAAVTGDGGPIIRFVVDEQPTLNGVAFTGNEVFSRTVLDALVRVETGVPVDMPAVRGGRAAIRQYYIEHGYPQVAVAWRIEGEGGTTELFYDIVEGPRILISTIDFDGNTVATDAELAALIAGPNGMNTIGGAYVAERMYDALAYVSHFYYDRGYVQVSTSAPNASLSEDGGAIVVSITLVEGDQYRFGAVTIGGDVAAGDKKYLKLIGFKKGDVFNRSKVVDAVNKITDAHKAAGHPNAEVIPSTNIDTDAHTIALELEVINGQR